MAHVYAAQEWEMLANNVIVSDIDNHLLGCMKAFGMV